MPILFSQDICDVYALHYALSIFKVGSLVQFFYILAFSWTTIFLMKTTLAVLVVLQLVVQLRSSLHSTLHNTKIISRKFTFSKCCAKCLILIPIYCKKLNAPENEKNPNIFYDRLKYMIKRRSPPMEVCTVWNQLLSSQSCRQLPKEAHESATAACIRYLFREVDRLPYSFSQISHARESMVDSIVRTALTVSTCNVLLFHLFESGTINFIPRVVNAAMAAGNLSLRALAILISGYGNLKDMSRVSFYYNLQQSLQPKISDSTQDDMIFLNNAYLKVLFLNGKEDLAMQSYTSQITRNETDFYTFNTALAHYEKVRNINESYATWMAVKAYHAQRSALQQDTVIPFGMELSVSLMVQCYLSAGEFAKAKELVEEFPCGTAVFSWLYHLAWKAKTIVDVLVELEDSFGGEKYPRLFGGARKIKHENRLVSSQSFLLEAIVSGMNRRHWDASQALEAYLTLINFFAQIWSTYTFDGSVAPDKQQSSSSCGSPVLVAVSEMIVASNMTIKTFNIVLNSVKGLAYTKSPAEINVKMVTRSAVHVRTKNPFKIYIHSIDIPEIRRVFKDAILSRLNLHSFQQQLCDAYTLATAMDFANVVRDPSLAEFIWSKRRIVFTASHTDPFSFERLYNAYLRSFRSKSQLFTLQKFVDDQFGIRILDIEETQLSHATDGVVHAPWIELHRHSIVSDRSADELVNAFLRVAGLPLALQVANCLLDSDKAGGRIRIVNAKTSNKIVLESSILNLAIAFDRRWRDSTQYQQDDNCVGTMLLQIEQLTDLVVSSRRLGPRNAHQENAHPKQAAIRREHLLWAAILAALLSRGQLYESRALIMKMETVGESDLRPPMSGLKDGLVAGQRRLYDVKEVVRVVELAVFSALDGSLPLLTENALTVLSLIQTKNSPTEGLASLLNLHDPNSPRLPGGELRTIANIADIIAFLQHFQPPNKNDPDDLKEIEANQRSLTDGTTMDPLLSPADRYRGPIGVSLLETLFYECVVHKNLASAVKIVRLLEFCRLVIDVDQPMRLMQTAAKVTAAEEERVKGQQAQSADYFEVDQADDKSVRVYLARKWTALLLARSLKTLRSSVLSKSIHFLVNKNKLDDKNSI